jgi:hypothetical protein
LEGQERAVWPSESDSVVSGTGRTRKRGKEYVEEEACKEEQDNGENSAKGMADVVETKDSPEEIQFSGNLASVLRGCWC